MLPTFLTQNYPLDKHFFLVSRIALGLIGFYPETERTLKVKLWALFNIVILVYGSFAELYYGMYYMRTNLPAALDALCPVASSIMSCIKLFFIYWYRKEFKNLIEKLRFLITQQKSPKILKIKKKYFTLATRLGAAVLFFASVTSTAYGLRPIVSNIMLYLQSKPIKYETPFNMMFPVAFLTMPLYPITFILVDWHGYITAFAFVGVDAIFLGFCIYFGILLKSLQEDIKTVLGNFNDKTYQLYDSEEKVFLALKKIVRRHNEIAELTNQFSFIMVEITLCQFITSSVIVATSVVDLLLFSGFGAVLYMIHTSAVFGEICLYSFGGNAIMETSEDLATAAYSCEWYTHSLKIQKMVLLIIKRAQRTILIKVPFFAPSLPALASIVRFTGSVVALVKSMV